MCCSALVSVFSSIVLSRVRYPGCCCGKVGLEEVKSVKRVCVKRRTPLTKDDLGVYLQSSVTCRHRLKLLCFRICTINTLQVSDSCAVFLIFAADDAFVAHKTAMWTDGKEAAAVSN